MVFNRKYFFRVTADGTKNPPVTSDNRPVISPYKADIEDVSLIAKLVDVETAEIIWIGSDSQESSLALEAADAMARRLIKSFSKELAKRRREV